MLSTDPYVTMQGIPHQDDIRETLKEEPRPDVVIPISMVEDWIGVAHLQEDPTPDRIGAQDPEMEEWAGSRVKQLNRRIARKAQAIEDGLRRHTTEAQWRDNVHREVAFNLKGMLHRWQLLSALRQMATNGWLARPLWNVQNDRQVKRLAEFAGDARPIDERSLEGRGRPRPKTFKTMRVRTETDWKKLGQQVKALGILRVAIDAGPVPAPHNGQPSKNQERLWLYRYRVGRVEEDGTWTDLRTMSHAQRARETSLEELSPFKERNLPSTDGTKGG
jgi:hypothetical protein